MDLFDGFEDDFVSVSSFATRSGGPRTPKFDNFIAVQQRYKFSAARDKLLKYITFKLSPKAMEATRLKKGDRVDVAYSPKSGRWRLKLIENGGYAISAGKTSKSGSIKITIYDGVQPIIESDPDKEHRAYGVSDDSKVITQFGEIIFPLTDVTISYE